jgi:cytidylate kinase
LIIAIDGPAASGKSTTARLLAKELDYLYVDTGAMYRAVTLKALRNNIDVRSEYALGQMVSEIDISITKENGDITIFLDHVDVSKEIRSPEVTASVSYVSKSASVRKKMIQLQRKIGREGNVVFEGRDIGSVVFPNADLKVFMRANLSERARRRKRELEEQQIDINIDEMKKAIERRDRIDSSRDLNPLVCPEDAKTIDTTDLTIQEQVAKIIQWVHEIRSK